MFTAIPTRADAHLLSVVGTARSDQVVVQQYVVVVSCTKVRRILLRSRLGIEPRRRHLGLLVAVCGATKSFR